MAKTNYSFDKRQREMAKKKKQDAKRLRKLEKIPVPSDDKGTPEPGSTKTGDLSRV